MALDPEVRRIVLLDGPAFLGDPSQWPFQNNCLKSIEQAIKTLIERNVLNNVDSRSAAHLLNSSALNAALFIAASDDPQQPLPKVIEIFTLLASGLRNN